MAIYVDSPKPWVGKRKFYSHMITDGPLDELHLFARQIGVQKHWFDRDHYDLRYSDFENAVANGASEVSTRRLILILRQNDACKRFN